MKKMKSFAAIAAAALMTAAMAVPAFAADITIDNSAAGETYNVYEIMKMDDGGYYMTEDMKTAYTATTGFDALFTVSGKTADGKYYVVPKTNNDPAIITWAAANKGILTQVAADEKATSNSTTIELANNGYYFVTSSLGGDYAVDTNDKTIKEKNTVDIVDDFEKTVADATVGLNDTADYTLKFTAIDNIVKLVDGAYTTETVTSYTVNDTCADLTVDMDSISVKVDNAVYTDFTKTYADGKLTIVINWDATTGTASEHAVEITYSAEVTANEREITNTADVSYNTTKFGEDEAKIYNTVVDIKKVDAKSKAVLAGAKFDLVNAEGKYYAIANGVVTWEDAAGDATGAISAADGTLKFEGLADGTYTLKETTAPAGYNVADDVTVTISDTVDADNNVTGLTVTNGTITVEDSTSNLLPSTGGIGTTIFYVVGGCLVAGAVVILVIKKRRA